MKRKGVGLIAASTLRAQIDTFTRFRKGKELSRFCGFSPRNASSGEHESSCGMIRAGDPGLRRVLIQVGHWLCCHDAHWRPFALRLINNGKPRPLVVVAVVNRWLRRLFYEMQDFELKQAA